MRSFSLLAASPAYLESRMEACRASGEAIPEQWRLVFDFVESITGERPAPAAPGDEEAALLELFRRFGHLEAELSPLGGIGAPPGPRSMLAGLRGPEVERLRSIYAGALAVETGHLDRRDTLEWITRAFETRAFAPDPETRRATLDTLIDTAEFEGFMARRFVGKKRFGGEGAEAFAPLLKSVLEGAVEAGVSEVVIGSMHRGRLNLLVNILGKPPAELFAEMSGAHPFEDGSPADVPYHLGLTNRLGIGGRPLDVTFMPNPSHLEAVNAVAMGFARARQDRAGGPAKVMPIILHTDASVAAQGVVAELIQMSGVAGFGCGGAVHLVVNNQVGFTTDPWSGRTSRYCTAPWRATDSLLLHVNAEAPDEAVRAGRMAAAFRAEFGLEAVVDLVGYRRNGHNEIDEPRFTQPLYYRSADQKPPVDVTYAEALMAEGAVERAAVEARREAQRARLDAAYADKRIRPPEVRTEPARVGRTGVDLGRLLALAQAITAAPAEVHAHPKAARILADRMGELETGLSWAFAESLALGTLIQDGVAVRLTGEDVTRGAFSHRHFALVDQTTGKPHRQLDLTPDARARFAVHDSPLSEYAVLGFEYGYSLAAHADLTIWEAQFGDFANCAQPVFDQFVFSGEEKWRLASGLAILLPHGLEGQGPEHSSARPERLLQMAAKDNVRITHPTTPANYFHLLRDQAARRRPLIVLSPKTLLRLPAAVSALADFAPGTGFRTAIAPRDLAGATRVVFCSGKIAYEVEALAAPGVRTVRLEQLYPFPEADILALGLPTRADYVWLQEEPVNFGCAGWIAPRLSALLGQAGVTAPLQVIARPESASPAGSFHMDHAADQQRLVFEAAGRGA